MLRFVVDTSTFTKRPQLQVLLSTFQSFIASHPGARNKWFLRVGPTNEQLACSQYTVYFSPPVHEFIAIAQIRGILSFLLFLVAGVTLFWFHPATYSHVFSVVCANFMVGWGLRGKIPFRTVSTSSHGLLSFLVVCHASRSRKMMHYYIFLFSWLGK